MKKFEKIFLVILFIIFGLLVLLFWSDRPSVLGGGVYQIIADNATNTVVTVASSDTTILPANANRHGVVFSLPRYATSAVWLTCGNTAAVVGSSIELSTSSEQRFEQGGDFVLSCPWRGISDNAGVRLGVMEW